MAAHSRRLTPEQLDDRLALAVSMVNDQLFNSDLDPLTVDQLSALRSPTLYRTVVGQVSDAARVDLSHALSLLDEWHAWNSHA